MITPPPPYSSDDKKDPQLFATSVPKAVEQADAMPEHREQDTVMPSQPSESKFKGAAGKLLGALDVYSTDEGPRVTNTSSMTAREQRVYEEMLATAESSPDLKVKAYYRKIAARFKKSDAKGRGTLANDVAKGMVLILAAPLALGAAGIIAAGGILYGTGVLVKGLGSAMTFGLVSNSSTGRRRPETQQGLSDDTREARSTM